MSRDTKIIGASAALAIAIAVGKNGAPSSVDAVIEIAKGELIPVGLNLLGLFLLLKFIK